jgi:hypothetical protein
MWWTRSAWPSMWPNIMVALVNMPSEWATYMVCEPGLGVALAQADLGAHGRGEDLAAAAGEGVQPASFSFASTQRVFSKVACRAG